MRNLPPRGIWGEGGGEASRVDPLQLLAASKSTRQERHRSGAQRPLPLAAQLPASPSRHRRLAMARTGSLCECLWLRRCARRPAAASLIREGRQVSPADGFWSVPRCSAFALTPPLPAALRCSVACGRASRGGSGVATPQRQVWPVAAARRGGLPLFTGQQRPSSRRIALKANFSPSPAGPPRPPCAGQRRTPRPAARLPSRR